MINGQQMRRLKMCVRPASAELHGYQSLGNVQVLIAIILNVTEWQLSMYRRWRPGKADMHLPHCKSHWQGMSYMRC